MHLRHDIHVAGVPVRALDAIELVWRLRNFGFHDTAERVQRGLTVRTLPVELRNVDREAVLHALYDRRRGGDLARLRSALIDERNAA